MGDKKKNTRNSSIEFLSTTNKRRFVKVVELILQVILFRLCFYFAGVAFGGDTISIKGIAGHTLPVNYFVILYCVLYIVSPYINICINKLSRQNFNKLIITVMIIFSLWTICVDFLVNVTGQSLNGLSTVGMYGSQDGYSIVNFILLYLAGAFIQRNKGFLSKRRSGIFSIILFIIIYICSIVEHKLGLEVTTTWNYNNPLLIILSSTVMIFFMNIKFENKIVNELAGAAFTCFLFHSSFMTLVGVENAVQSNLVMLIIHQFGVGIGLFLMSYVVYKIYTLCTGWIIRLVAPVCDKVNISVEE